MEVEGGRAGGHYCGLARQAELRFVSGCVGYNAPGGGEGGRGVIMGGKARGPSVFLSLTAGRVKKA